MAKITKKSLSILLVEIIQAELKTVIVLNSFKRKNAGIKTQIFTKLKDIEKKLEQLKTEL